MSLQNGELEACIRSHKTPDDLLDIMDPEWVKMWDEHGANKLRADEVSVEVYRQNPAAYTFSYAAWKGKYAILYSYKSLGNANERYASQAPRFTRPKTSRFL